MTGSSRYVRFALDDGSEITFESADRGPVAPRGGDTTPDEGGALRQRFTGVVATAGQLLDSVRSGLSGAEEVQLAFAVGVSSDVGWFFAKGHAEGSISVTVKWRNNQNAADPVTGTHEADLGGGGSENEAEG